MNSNKNSKSKFNKKKILTIVVADFLIFAISLLTFAYFDHVRPSGDKTEVPPILPPSFDLSFDAEFSTDDNSEPDSSTEPEHSSNPDNSTDSDNSEADVSVENDSSEEPSQDDTSKEPPKESVFTNGEIISTDTEYKSPFVSITVKEITFGGVVYMVQDVYIKHIESFGCGFAKGLSPLSGEKSTIYEMVEHYRSKGYNIIAATNGDYCGYNRLGATIRNGVLYWSGVAENDVCVLYKDKTMKIIPKDDFDANTELENGAWQAWDFGPALLDENGNALETFTQKTDIQKANPRTAIGYYEPGHYCFVVVGGRGEKKDGKTPAGVSFKQLSAFMETLECNMAYNLDGGRSSIMVYKDRIVNEKYQDTERNNTDMLFIQDFNVN